MNTFEGVPSDIKETINNGYSFRKSPLALLCQRGGLFLPLAKGG